jgi:hypothetical protein
MELERSLRFQEAKRILEKALDLLHKVGASGPIHYPMVSAEGDIDALANGNRIVIQHDGFLNNSRDRQDRSLGWIDDRNEVFHVEGSQIGDGKCPPLVFAGRQFFLTGLVNELAGGRPSSSATAIPTCAAPNVAILSLRKALLTAGCLISAIAAAFTTISLSEILASRSS